MLISSRLAQYIWRLLANRRSGNGSSPILNNGETTGTPVSRKTPKITRLNRTRSASTTRAVQIQPLTSVLRVAPSCRCTRKFWRKVHIAATNKNHWLEVSSPEVKLSPCAKVCEVRPAAM